MNKSFVDVVMFIALWSFIILIGSILLGCTAATYERDAARVAAAKGCYCSATECKQVVSAVGVAATVAAEREKLRAVQVTRK